jgi:hypothetical protein
MDFARFDALTRQLSERRSLLGALGGALLGTSGLPLAALAGKRRNKGKGKGKGKAKKKGCRGAGRPCSAGGQCCGKNSCSEGRCCKPSRVFVRCPDQCLCGENLEFCCAGEPDPPDPICEDRDVAEEFCCRAADLCGDICCDPVLERCVGGVCVCRPENQCGAHCCDMTRCDCDISHEPAICTGLDCPSGSGGFARVRRIKAS